MVTYLPFPGVGCGIVASYHPLIVHLIVGRWFSPNQGFGAHVIINKEHTGDIYLKFINIPHFKLNKKDSPKQDRKATSPIMLEHCETLTV